MRALAAALGTAVAPPTPAAGPGAAADAAAVARSSRRRSSHGNPPAAGICGMTAAAARPRRRNRAGHRVPARRPPRALGGVSAEGRVDCARTARPCSPTSSTTTSPRTGARDRQRDACGGLDPSRPRAHIPARNADRNVPVADVRHRRDRRTRRRRRDPLRRARQISHHGWPVHELRRAARGLVLADARARPRHGPDGRHRA